MKGDGYQNGGALVVEVGGSKTLLHYVQKEAPDHVSNADVLKVRTKLIGIDLNFTWKSII